jgi:hypothetical protein
MAKRKNYSNHNQNRKHHRNGIKRPKIPPFDQLGSISEKGRLRVQQMRAEMEKNKSA